MCEISRSMYSFNFVLLILMAVFFYRAADFEDGPRLLWTALSVAISLLTWQVLRMGLLEMMLGQAGLFVGITLVRARRKP
jgi:hypothetical protein